jgi:hypothetical protein
MVRYARSCAVVAALASLVAFSAPSSAQPFANAVRTIFLATGTDSISSIAYHPGFDQYYSSDIGSTNQPAFVYDSAGSLVHTEDPINIDVRALYYNPNTDLIEAVSFNAQSGGVARGLIDAQLDGSGFFTGGTATLLASMPGLASSQTVPAYDPVRDQLYSRDGSNTVNVVRRSDGALAGTITLDFATAGVGTVSTYTIAYVPEEDWLVVADRDNDTAVAFDINGDYVGTAALDIDVNVNYGIGYANGQLFIEDGSRDGYQGYRITNASSDAPTAVPALPPGGILLLVLGMLGLTVRHRAR